MGTFSGSMKLQSKTWNGVLSTLRDNWNMLLAKFGLPIIEKITPILAAIGESIGALQDKAEKLGEMFIDFFMGKGAKAIAGFQSSVDAFKTGNVTLAFKAMGASIKLQFMESANSIHANLIGAFAAVRHAAVRLLGPDSALWTLITRGIEVAGLKLSSSLSSGMGTVFQAIGNALPIGMDYMWNRVAKSLKEETEKTEQKVKRHTAVIRKVIKGLPDEVLAIGKESAEAFSEGFKNADDLFDTRKVKANLDALHAEIKQAMERLARSASAWPSGCLN